MSADRDRSCRSRQIACDDVHGRRFPGTVRAEKAEYFIVTDLEADALDGGIASVMLCQVPDLNHSNDTPFLFY